MRARLWQGFELKVESESDLLATNDVKTQFG